jgi:hypothetical protein
MLRFFRLVYVPHWNDSTFVIFIYELSWMRNYDLGKYVHVEKVGNIQRITQIYLDGHYGISRLSDFSPENH